MAIYFIDRKTGEKKEEIVAGEGFLKWIYESNIGRNFLEIFIKKKIFSLFYGMLQNLSFSTRKIDKFVDELKIDMAEADREQSSDYLSFNDFFARNLKPEARPIIDDENILISPADGRVLAYTDIDKNQMLQVKGSFFTLKDLFQDEGLALEYTNGACIIIRLCPADYHRFHFPDKGVPGKARLIEGHYYSVNPISLKEVTEVYCQNKREITLFKSQNFGEIALIEVGATCVGSIIQSYTPYKSVEKGQEKGYFKFGGSTVIMLLKENRIRIDEDIIENTFRGLETKVNMGERIGVFINTLN